MNWEAVGAIGEVVGAVGVIATLAYLAMQIRQNSDVVRSSTRQAVSTAQTEIGMRVAANPELAAALLSWRGDAPVPASAGERLRNEMLMRAFLRTFENQYHQNQDGTFEDAMWAGYVESMSRIFELPSFADWWQDGRSLYSPDFAAFVDDVIRASRGQDTPPKASPR